MKRLIFLLVWVAAGHLLAAAPVYGGYTQYFTWKQEPDPERVRACVADMGRVVGAARRLLAGPDGDGAPRVEPLEVEFNGIGPDAHEPFVFPGKPGFNFCKTAGKPYDAAVTACLLVARDHFSPAELEIKSDGEWNDGAWVPGARLFKKVFGRQPSNPMTDGPPAGGNGGQPLPAAVSVVISVVFFGILVAILHRVRER